MFHYSIFFSGCEPFPNIFLIDVGFRSILSYGLFAALELLPIGTSMVECKINGIITERALEIAQAHPKIGFPLIDDWLVALISSSVRNACQWRKCLVMN